MKNHELSAHWSAATASKSAQSVAFSDRFRALCARARFTAADVGVASEAETLAALELARERIPVVAPEVARRIHRHNPDCFRIVRREPFAQSAMMAWLPLTELGAAALVDDRFDGLAPDLAHVCAPGEPPAAIYLWLVYTPGHMVSGLKLLEVLETLGGGVPIFTRPAHDESARILAMAGFLPAPGFFPSAPAWLVVALTAAPAPTARRAAAIGVRVARSLDDLLKVFAVRTATYMGEQACSYDEEFDGNDLCATHLIGEIDGEPAGCVRIRYFGSFAKLERLAVRPDQRRSRLMPELVRAAFAHCARKGFTKLYAHARADLVPAWQRFGARLIADRPAFSFSDVEFREMELDLAPDPAAIALGADPLMLIRPEGDWDRLGPIDRAQLVLNRDRRDHVQQLRKFKG